MTPEPPALVLPVINVIETLSNEYCWPLWSRRSRPIQARSEAQQ